MMLKPAIVGALLAMFLATSAHVGQVPDTLQDGRAATARFYAGETEALWGQFSPEMRQAFGDEAGLRAFRGEVLAQLGAEERVLDERVTRLLRFRTYTRTAAFAGSPVPVQVQWSFDGDGTIAGFFIRPAPEPAASRYLDYETRTPLRLPFDGAWYVFWGGRSVTENYHAEAEDQRFAYDFLVERDGVTHEGDGGTNEQYFCFGRTVLAPAAGTVVAALDGIPDNRPGVMNAEQPMGNHAIIDHGNGEFSVLAHLQRGSVRVATGDRVESGDALGTCGNSGNSSEPHLHYHLQTSATPFEGEGLPAQFRSYLADGIPVARGEPTQGQTVQNE